MNHSLLSAPLRVGLLHLLRRPAVARAGCWLLLLALLPVHLGCQSYYRTRSREVNAPTLTTLASSKVFVVHQGNFTWQLVSPQLKGETLEGLKGELYAQLAEYDVAPFGGGSTRYRLQDKKLVMNLVHVYISEFQSGENQQVRIPLSAIQRIDLIEPDTGRTAASYTLGAVGVAAGVIALLTIIAFLTKSSCPFVYAHDGQQYRFVGEAYSGAIFAPLERDDYLPLPGIRPHDGQYLLKLSNELQERQFTDLAELWVVTHPAGTQVLLDQRGAVHTLAQPAAPLSAVSAAGHDATAQVQAADRSVFLFNEDLPAANGLTLTFDRPAQARTAKLVLRAQNSLWLDYLYGEFAKKFGAMYPAWARHEKTLPAEALHRWLREQELPLRVSIDTGHGWRPVENIPMVGPLAARDLVVPLDLVDVAGPQVRVRVEAGFMFWELDYAALDTSPAAPTAVAKSSSQAAVDEKGLDQRRSLAAADGQPLQQLRPGTQVTLTFPAGAAPAGTQHSAFLRTRGYYEHIRSYEGLPDLPELYAFRKPGRFVEFSKERYREATRQLNLTALQR